MPRVVQGESCDLRRVNVSETSADIAIILDGGFNGRKEHIVCDVEVDSPEPSNYDVFVVSISSGTNYFVQNKQKLKLMSTHDIYRSCDNIAVLYNNNNTSLLH